MINYARLGDICRPKQWRTLPKKALHDSGYPVYGANGKIGYFESYTHEEPTILVGCRGSCGSVHLSEPKSYVNGNSMALGDLDNERVDVSYLYRFLSYRGFEDTITGTSQPQIIGANIRKVEVPLPSLPEQRRIAAILDKADALRQKRREAIAKLDQLLQSVFLDMFGGPVANQRNWPLKSLDDLSAQLKRGPFGGSLKKEIFVQEGYKVYEQQHAISGDFSLGTYYIDEAKFQEMKSFAVQPNDLIISCSGTMGRVAIVPESASPGVINQALLKVTVRDDLIRTEFLADLLRSDRMEFHFFGISRGSGLKNFPPMSDVRAMQIVLPPLGLQDQYLKIKQRIDTSKRSMKIGPLDQLFGSLQQRAFTGQL